MKLRKLFFGILTMVALTTISTSCDDDDDVKFDDEGSKVELPGKRAYILFEGSFGMNNSGLTMYDPSSSMDVIGDIYQVQNDKALGETAQSLIEENNYMYCVDANSVKRMNAAGVETNNYKFEKEFGAARYCEYEDGYVYVTHYGGKVSKHDGKTLSLISSVNTGGQQLEGIVECNNRLYIANGYTPEYNYLKEVIVVNPQSMQKEATIEVVENPNAMIEVNDKVYLISIGNYYDVQAQLQVIDPRQNNKMTVITEASRMAEAQRGVIYLIKSGYDENYNPMNTFFSYDTKTETINNESFIKDATDELAKANIYMMKVDEETGEIYIATTDYKTNGDIYRFDAKGKLIQKFKAGGINPNSMVFID